MISLSRWMIALFAGCTINTIATAAPAPAPPVGNTVRECSGKLFLSQCRDFSKEPLDLRKDTSEADGVIFNYFLLNSRDHFYEILRFNRDASPDLGKRALKIADEVRDAAIGFVTGGAPEESWTADARVIVTRLRAVGFKLVSSTDPGCMIQGDPGIPTASYNRSTDNIEICPGQVKTTTQDIAASIAHELGHATGPCGFFRAFEYGRMKSQLDLKAYSGIRQCLEKRYAGDYDDWLAQSVLGIEKLPKRYDTIPGRAATEWPARIEAAKQETPLVCYRKLDEHFSDSFGGQVYSNWIRSREMNKAQFELGLHSYIAAKCVEQTNKAFKNNMLYPSSEDRLTLYLKPRAVANLMSCQPLTSNAICSLTEESFTSGPAVNANQPAASGIKR